MKNENILEHKNRLDVEMQNRKLARSRSHASDLIKRKKVSVNGFFFEKPSALVSPTDAIEIVQNNSFVSRAGEKLLYALGAFQIDARGAVAMDIGSSTGGFTDCLLKNGASRVVAIDVGRGQFVNELAVNSRVELHEGTDIRKFKSSEKFDVVVIDVSFISLSLILSSAFEFLKPGSSAVVLVKPQFEVGMEIAQKHKGVINDEKLWSDVVSRIKKESFQIGFKVIDEVASPILGEKGNKEFLLHLKKLV
jgi:23S rRNA (cytidine1920-2'-O)/16S rRNA (cytidine1409-2'-O)-methyltransferase